MFNKESDIKAAVFQSERTASEVLSFTDLMAWCMLEDNLDFITSDGLSSIEIKLLQSIIWIDDLNFFKLFKFFSIMFWLPKSINL